MDASERQGAESAVPPRPGSEGSLLRETVTTLTRTIADIENELTRSLDLKKALESGLERRRKQVFQLERSSELLRKRIREHAEQTTQVEPLKVKIQQLEVERSKAASSMQALGGQSARVEKENQGLRETFDRLRLETQVAGAELDRLEAQLERAVEVAADLRMRSEALVEERESLTDRLNTLDKQLQAATSERDGLHDEVAESRKALEEVRSSLDEQTSLSQRRP